jgi:YHS domain-containing protein
MAACKCRYCQTNLTTAIAYKVENKNKKAYFCNQEHYAKFLQEEENKKKKQVQEAQTREKFYNLFCEILGVNGITNTALWKEKTEINKVFSDEVIISYLEENKNWITTSVSKLSGGEYGKIRYVSVILRNKLGDYNPKATIKEVEKPKVQVDEGFYVISHKQNGKRRSLDELEDEY